MSNIKKFSSFFCHKCALCFVIMPWQKNENVENSHSLASTFLKHFMPRLMRLNDHFGGMNGLIGEYLIWPVSNVHNQVKAELYQKFQILENR